LVVDLDGTLLKVDSFDEAFVWLFWHKPLRLGWLLIQKFWQKRAPFKWEFYQGVELGELPFNDELVAWLREQKSQGRRLILCSGTPQFYVEKIGARQGGLFDEFVGSSREVNRKGGARRNIWWGDLAKRVSIM
jgi:phosphoserine phosphatase